MESKDSSEKVLKSMQAILALIAKDLSPSGAEKAKKIAADLDEVEKRMKKGETDSDSTTDTPSKNEKSE